MLKFFHLFHNLYNFWTFDINKTKRCYIHAIILKVLQIIRLDILQADYGIWHSSVSERGFEEKERNKEKKENFLNTVLVRDA